MKKQLLTLILLLIVALTACEEFPDEYYDEADYELDEPIVEEDDFGEDAEGGTAVSIPGSATQETFENNPCPFNITGSADIECGTLTVPEDRSRANSPLIQLAVAIVRASGGSRAAPVIYLAGGPGGSAIDDYAADPSSWDYPFLENRDFILLDQRGTGYSQPSLDCPEFAEVDAQDNPDALCYDRLVADGINLDAYNTRENAADVAALRSALGIAEWDLLGISYGTRLALAVMRYHPEGVRAVILDSPFPPNADTPLDEIYSLTDALTELFADCERDAYCREEYPDLETVFLDTVQRLNDDETAEIYGDDLVFALSGAFSETDLIPLLPYVIYEVADGNYAALDEISMDGGFTLRFQNDGADRSDSEGMYNSVICHDEFATGDYERVETAVVGTIPTELEGALLQNTYDQMQLCALWNPKTAVDNTAVSSSIPTLILVGQYDVATPPRWATLTAATLSNAYLFEAPGAGHSILSTVECSLTIANDFLNEPGVEPNGRCLDDIECPYFE
jgi:pimeloyl-ACP methyl ester carboxylesterase